MDELERGRRTHDPAAVGDQVVFLIGMRINRPWRPDGWLPVFAAMPRMLTELSRDPGSGLLGYRLAFGRGGPAVIQYWRSAEDLYAYASAPDAEHRPAWAAFNRRARRKPGVVGVWHETYPVRRAETMYVDMPASGLGRAVGTVAATGRLEHARDRLEPAGDRPAD